MGIQQTLLRGMAPPPIIQWYGSRGVFVGGATPTMLDVMDYVNIASTGNASDFGNITTGTRNCAGYSGTLSAARGVFKGDSPGAGGYDQIEYITITTTGNASDYGDLAYGGKTTIGAVSNGTRGVFAGGANPGSIVMQYRDIANLGNTSEFGNLTIGRYGTTGVGNGTRGVFAGGNKGNPTNNEVNTIDYITVASTGNASDFGDTIQSKVFRMAGMVGGDRGVWAAGGGPSSSNVIQYVTITSTGNATDFGDLNRSDEHGPGGNSNNTRGLIGGGRISPAATNQIRYITIASTSNTSDFGDLTVARYYVGSSGCAGGAV